jgi:hypothetical protein
VDEEHDAAHAEEKPVIDIHPPHEAAHSWRDIFIHLATITVGLFIALSLEGCVEWQHHRHLVHEARENLRSELQDNLGSIRDALTEIHNQQKMIEADLVTFDTLRKNPHAHGVSINFHFSNTTLQHASWDTARETGALGYMPYPEVKSYAQIADMQKEFATSTDRLVDAYAPAIAYLYGFRDDQSSKAAAAGSEPHSTAPAADIVKTISEGQHIALNIQSELLLCEATAQGLQKQYSTVLASTPR